MRKRSLEQRQSVKCGLQDRGAFASPGESDSLAVLAGALAGCPNSSFGKLPTPTSCALVMPCKPTAPTGDRADRADRVRRRQDRPPLRRDRPRLRRDDPDTTKLTHL